MYEMTLNGESFFCPSNEKYTFTGLVLHEALNDAGYIDAVVPDTNPLYDKVEEIASKIELLKDNDSKFAGYIANIKLDFQKQKHLYIVGELSYLSGSVVEQQNRSGSTKAQLLDVLLKSHNAQSEEKFYPGMVGVNQPITNGLIDYGYTLETIKKYICGSDGYIKVVKRNGRREIDILPIENYGKQSKQYIRFASNLLDYTQDISGDTIITAILPLGTRKNTSEVEGLDSYVDISSVNSGSKILVNQVAVKHYGYRCKVVYFDTDDPAALMKYGKEYLTNFQFASMSIQLTAVDLSELDSGQDDYEVGDYVRCTAEPFNMDRWFPATKKDTDILDISQNRILLGITGLTTLTKATTGEITSLHAQLPQQNSILESAQKNATALIVNATTGYVTTRNDEITIADNPDIAKAVKVWRWNMGGLGYSNTGYNGKYGTAITMDGSIVANFITAGEMSADRVRGGQFVVGGTGTGVDGEIIGYTASNKEIFRLNKNGGTFNGILGADSLSGGAGQQLQEAINTANSAIATANLAIQQAQQAANNAQSTANTANSAASTAQSAADTAKGAAETAQNTATVAKNAVTYSGVVASQKNAILLTASSIGTGFSVKGEDGKSHLVYPLVNPSFRSINYTGWVDSATR